MHVHRPLTSSKTRTTQNKFPPVFILQLFEPASHPPPTRDGTRGRLMSQQSTLPDNTSSTKRVNVKLRGDDGKKLVAFLPTYLAVVPASWLAAAPSSLAGSGEGVWSREECRTWWGRKRPALVLVLVLSLMQAPPPAVVHATPRY